MTSQEGGPKYHLELHHPPLVGPIYRLLPLFSQSIVYEAGLLANLWSWSRQSQESVCVCVCGLRLLAEGEETCLGHTPPTSTRLLDCWFLTGAKHSSTHLLGERSRQRARCSLTSVTNQDRGHRLSNCCPPRQRLTHTHTPDRLVVYGC